MKKGDTVAKKEIPRQWWNMQTETIETWRDARTPNEHINWNPENSEEADAAQALHKKGGPIVLIDKNEWMKNAECRGMDPNIMIPAQGRPNKKAVAAAKAICDTCIVIDDCLASALSDPYQIGIMGGMTKAERSRLSRPE